MSRLPLSLAAVSAALLLGACGQKTEAPAATQTASEAASAQACGRVRIANMTWQSAELLANVDKLILSAGYGCDVELVAGDTMPTLTSMIEKGQPDIAPEAWVNAIREPLENAVKDGRLQFAARSLPDGGVEGWWIPKHVAEAHPEIKTIDDALKRPDLFPSVEAKGKGAVHNCPSGWSCQITTENAFKAWGAKDKGFVLVDTGSAAGLDGSIAKASERKEGWLGYYWAPTAILGKYEMVKLDAGVPHDKAAYEGCNTRADCEKPAKTDWGHTDVYTVVTTDFKQRAGQAMGYLSVRGWSNDTVNRLLAWMGDNQATGEDGARHFLRTQPELWKTWVSPEVAARVEAAL